MRAQAEMIGLMMIVVFLAVGFLLFVRFGLEDNDTGKAAFQETQMGQSFLNSMTRATVYCGGRKFQMKDLLERIVLSGGVPGCNAEEAVVAKFEQVLAQTFDVWGINYRLKFELNREQGATELSGSMLPLTNPNVLPVEVRCSDSMDRQADQLLIPVGVTQQQIRILFERCN